jgi:hypothetical protein
MKSFKKIKIEIKEKKVLEFNQSSVDNITVLSG